MAGFNLTLNKISFHQDRVKTRRLITLILLIDYFLFEELPYF
jgi:hypothetical protein